MARYYEENALIEFVKQHTPTINGEATMECVERTIRNAPTADEVERLRGELARANRILREIKQAHRRCNHWKLAQIIEGDEL